ncbi:hypothetical protein LV469_02955 [Peptoniphilus sp. GNH]|nr:hypothetical protein LV469_02955 [Peptoniphilus sp. GNH]
MTEKEEKRLQELYLRQIEDYCNILFKEPYPSGVALALENLVKLDPMKFNVASEKLSDMSITYVNGNGSGGGSSGLPDFILEWINPYRRPYIMSDKIKKYYDDGRR